MAFTLKLPEGETTIRILEPIPEHRVVMTEAEFEGYNANMAVCDCPLCKRFGPPTSSKA